MFTYIQLKSLIPSTKKHAAHYTFEKHILIKY